MDAIREQINRPMVAGIVGLVVGIFFGLVVLGWGLFPVEWTETDPVDLNQASQEEWMRMTIEGFAQNGDVAKAKTRYDALGENKEEVLSAVASTAGPGSVSIDMVMLFSAAVAPGAAPQATSPVLVTQAPQATAAAGGGLLDNLLTVLCIGALVLAAAVIVFFIMRSRSPVGPRTSGLPIQTSPADRQATWTDYSTAGTEPPMAQFMASYKLGDDLFDDSFSVDSPAGEFLGECGVGISETIGVGEPKKVTAFEVWLFDKNDIQTVTKVLMSNHAFNDGATRQRLTAKGEPVLVEPGSETMLETQTLQMVARVVDMGYGEGALPSQSYFDRFVLELAVWPKPHS